MNFNELIDEFEWKKFNEFNGPTKMRIPLNFIKLLVTYSETIDAIHFLGS